MSGNEMVVSGGGGASLTAIEIKAQVQRIQEVMKAVMQKDVHYGIIPGCKKPSLYKPGSEKLLSTFNIAIEPVVTDLSTYDEAKFRVEVRATNYISGVYLGSGVGECSSNEEKYKWRKSVCDEEFDETPEDRKREKWAVDYKTKKSYKIKQVRMNVSDVANTVLKMAKKRAQIDATLTVTAASDIFTQDLEDLPPEMQDASDVKASTSTPIKPPQRKSETTPAPAASPNGDTISEPQRKRFYAIYKNARLEDDHVKDYLLREYGIEHSSDIKRSDYEAICNWVEGKPTKTQKHTEENATREADKREPGMEG